MNGPTAEASAAVVIAKNPAKGQCLVNGIQLGVILTDYPPEQLRITSRNHSHGVSVLMRSGVMGSCSWPMRHHIHIVVYPRIVSTDLDGLFCKIHLASTSLILI
jgi:hypothetical protein